MAKPKSKSVKKAKSKKAAPRKPGRKQDAKKAKAAKPRKAQKPQPLVDDDEPSRLELGPIELPASGAAALELLQEIAELNDLSLRAHQRYVDAAAVAKNRKADWESAAQRLQTRLRNATHKSPLPLFDQAERDQELTRMAENQVKPAAGEAAETVQEDAGEPFNPPTTH